MRSHQARASGASADLPLISEAQTLLDALGSMLLASAPTPDFNSMKSCNCSFHDSIFPLFEDPITSLYSFRCGSCPRRVSSRSYRATCCPATARFRQLQASHQLPSPQSGPMIPNPGYASHPPAGRKRSRSRRRYGSQTRQSPYCSTGQLDITRHRATVRTR